MTHHWQTFKVLIKIRDENGRLYLIHTVEDFKVEPFDTDAPEMEKPYEIVETRIAKDYRTLIALGCNGTLINLTP